MHKINQMIKNTIEQAMMRNSHRVEIRKFKDKKREDIYAHVELTAEQKAEIDKLYIENYGKKIPYIWHRYYTAFTGHFDPGYMPELLYIPEFERFMNLNTAAAKAISDKNLMPMLAKSAGIKTPKAYLSCTYGVYRIGADTCVSKEEACELLGNLGKAFAKPSVETGSGRGCALIDMQNGTDKVSGKSAEVLLEELSDNFVIQERIKCHKSIADIYADSVNTFRIISYRWKDRIEFFPPVMRIGQGGGYLDNAHAGGMFVAVENAGGG